MFQLENVIYREIVNIGRLEIAAGEMTCLFGPSGCGKTTLLRMLNGMLSPDSGTILFRGEPVSDTDLVSLRRKVVMLAQQSTLFPGDMRGNLNIGAEFQEKPPFPDEMLAELLTRVGLGDKKLDDNPELFSGGEKQRLTLARVLLLQPPVLLLDEPGSALDAATETVIMDLIAEDQRTRGATCVLVTHSEDMAKKYSDRIVYLEAGRVLRIEEQGHKRSTPASSSAETEAERK